MNKIRSLLTPKLPEGEDPSYRVFVQRLRTDLMHTTKIRSITVVHGVYDILVDVIPENGTHPFQEHYTFTQQNLSPSQRDHLRQLYTTYHSERHGGHG